MEWMLDVQLGRRNLNKAQRILAAEKFRKYYEQQARKNLVTSTGGNNARPLTKWTKADNDQIHVRTKLSDKAGVGSGTYYRYKTVLYSDNEGLTQQMLGVQLGRRNLTDFMKNEIALKYEDLIAKRMKERQSAAGGDKRSVNVKNIASDHLINSDKTTSRKELSKIAGTSEASIQRSKLILQKGTPEQIQRAREGGKGNTISAIAKEIQEEEKKKKSNILEPLGASATSSLHLILLLHLLTITCSTSGVYFASYLSPSKSSSEKYLSPSPDKMGQK